MSETYHLVCEYCDESIAICKDKTWRPIFGDVVRASLFLYPDGTKVTSDDIIRCGECGRKPDNVLKGKGFQLRKAIS